MNPDFLREDVFESIKDTRVDSDAGNRVLRYNVLQVKNIKKNRFEGEVQLLLRYDGVTYGYFFHKNKYNYDRGDVFFDDILKILQERKKLVRDLSLGRKRKLEEIFS